MIRESLLATSLLATIFLLTFCVNDHQEKVANINGDWYWYKTYNPWTGTVYADSVDFSLTLSIDKRAQEAQQYRDGMLVNRYTMKWEYSDWTSAETSIGSWHLYPEEGGGVVSVIDIQSAHEMAVINICYDCPRFYYRR